jgi:hypothetical protein
MKTIDEIVRELLRIKKEQGNLFVGQIFYGSDDYPKIEVEFVFPAIVTNPLDTSKYIVIFD